MNTSVALQAVDVLAQATAAMKLDLVELVACCSIWAHPEVVAVLIRLDRNATWNGGVRRYRRKSGEKKGQVIDNIRLDDNTFPNNAIKRVIFGSVRPKGFHACHVWPESCYDERYHTSIANLVLLPAPLASLSDYDLAVVAALKYRAFELFGWHPEGESIPDRPASYPAEGIWRETPAPTPTLLNLVERRGRARLAIGEPANSLQLMI